MTFEHRDNSFSAFKNKRKEQPTHADYTGDGMIDGKKVWINIWVKKDKNGNQYFSGSVRAQGEQKAQSRPKPPVYDQEEVPF